MVTKLEPRRAAVAPSGPASQSRKVSHTLLQDGVAADAVECVGALSETLYQNHTNN